MKLITGANGHLGSATIDFLLEKNPDADLAGLVRSEEKGAGLRKKGVSGLAITAITHPSKMPWRELMICYLSPQAAWKTGWRNTNM